MRFNSKITSDRFDRRLCRYVSFVGAPTVFTCAVLALGRLGASPAEFLIGVLTASATAVSMVVMGCVTGPANAAK